MLLLRRFVVGATRATASTGRCMRARVEIAVRVAGATPPCVCSPTATSGSRHALGALGLCAVSVQPADPLMEVNDRGEVICTVSRLDLLAPRIRYNVHDSGGIVPYAKVRRALHGYGFDLDALGRGAGGPRPARPAAVGSPDPAAVPVDPRPARRDGQRHGLEHLPRGHRDRPVSRPAGRAAAALVHALGRRRRRPGRRGRRSPWS